MGDLYATVFGGIFLGCGALLAVFILLVVADFKLFSQSKNYHKELYNQPEKPKKLVKKEPKPVDRSFGNPYLKRYYDALDAGDKEGMMQALLDCKANCSAANSWCLTEMFCPECPFCGLPVMSGRQGLEKL